MYIMTTDLVYRKGRAPSLAALLADDATEGEFRDEVYAKRPIVRTTKLEKSDEICNFLSQEELYRRILVAAKWTAMRSIAKERGPLCDRYHEAHIPKKSGGVRRLLVPDEGLKRFQKHAVRALVKAVGADGHSAAFAFRKGRSVKDAMQRHQWNRSRWFLKLDFKDFFESTTEDVACEQLLKILPFHPYGYEEAVSVFFCDGRLPQGAPSSPAVSNLVMVPFDYELTQALRKEGFVYTRYADDMLISHKDKFDWREMIETVTDTFAELKLPYRLNHTKTRFGSSSGRNWNLGLMLNKDNDLTVGWRNKKLLKARLCREAERAKRDEPADPSLQGLVAWYRMTEPETIEELVGRYGKKFDVKLTERLNIRTK